MNDVSYSELPTCITSVKGREDFKGKIDYIFATKNFLPFSVEISTVENILPDEKNPSDHLPVRCCL